MAKQVWLITCTLLGVVTAVALSGPSAAARPDSDTARVVSTLDSMYAAMQADNIARYRDIVTPDFYAFDQGQRFDGDALVRQVKALHAKGYVFKWIVTQPDVHVLGDVAWVSYIVRGSIRDHAGETPETWQDSAVLARVNGGWRVRFLHSSQARDGR
jgi:ketosteroid isomerase-like protein